MSVTEESKQIKNDSIDMDYIGSREENAESRSVSSRARIRNKLSSEIEEFLSRGGQINKIDADVTADPPRKPENNYGGRAI